jgi:K+-sensing histidine kinase KdpD
MILGVVLVALLWGAGPSLVATFVGVLLLEVLIFPPPVSGTPTNVIDAISDGLVLGVGVLISLFAGQVARARHEADQARKASDTRARELETILETITDGVAVVDQAGHILRSNRANLELRRLLTPSTDLERPLGERLARMGMRDEAGHALAPEQVPAFRALGGERLGGASTADVVLRTLEGEDLHLQVSGAPLRTAEGQRVGAVVVSRDVTGRRRLEQRTQHTLAALIQLAHALLGASSEEALLPSILAERLAAFTSEALGEERVMLTTWDPETGLLHPLVAAGFTPEQEARWRAGFAGIPLHAWWGAEVAAQLEAGEVVQIADADAALFQAPNVFDLPRRVLAPLLGEHGLSGFLALGRSASKPPFTPQEEALLLAVAHFCALALERERLLSERETARAHALALHEANRQMDTFLGMVSHELRSPLTSLRLRAQAITRRLERARFETGASERDHQALLTTLQELFAPSERQVALLERLVKELLDTSRIKEGTLDLQLQHADLRELVQEVVEEQRALAPERVIQLETPADQALLVRIDRDLIRQAVTNYLTNALKYSPEAAPVRVGVEREAELARLWVRDQGSGIAREDQARIWERFQRVAGKEAHTSSVRGLGLGLYITKMLVERHQGQVWMSSSPGQGATFWLTLPLERQQEVVS